MLALKGLTVLDVTQVMAGPYCTMLLGDMGADVIKVEPLEGDPTRRALRTTVPGKDSSGFVQLNRNKRSLALDLKAEGAKAILHRLIRSADVLVENGRPGVAQRLGYGYEEARDLNPRLIYASISGFGQSGPWSQRPGFDMVAQAMSGVMSVTGHGDQSPCRNTIPAGDLGAGMLAANGILGAVLERQQTGRGRRIDVSLFDTLLGMSVWEAAEYWDSGESPGPSGSANRMSAPYQAVKAQDGYFVLAAATQRLWLKLCDLLERPDLVADPRYADSSLRLQNREPLIVELERELQQAPAEVWVQRLLERGIPAGEIHGYDISLSSEHVRERQMVLEVQQSGGGRTRMLGSPLKLDSEPLNLHRAPPHLGEQTCEVLQGLGLGEDEITALCQEGVVFAPEPLPS